MKTSHILSALSLVAILSSSALAKFEPAGSQ